MKEQTLHILQYLYHETSVSGFLTMDDLEVNFGLTGYELRSYLEDLKHLGYVFESDEGFWISESGINFSQRYWV